MSMPFYPPSRPRAVEGGIAARSSRGSIGDSWWSQRFITVLEGFALGSRLTRGRNYARRGQVISLQVASGEVTARVQGSRAAPYRVALGLAPFTAATWSTVDAALAGQAIHSAALLAGQMPPDLEGVLAAAGAQLFPQSVRDLRMSCSCPDAAVPCKHIAASFYLLAERFDEDPFEILHWRGRPREALLARLRELRADEPCVDSGAKSGTRSATESGTKSGTRSGRVSGAVPPGGARVGAAPSAASDPAAGSPIGTAIALADLAEAEPPGASVAAMLFWSSPVPLPPAEPGPATPPDLLVRQLPDPPAALGGSVLTDALRELYLALPDPEQADRPTGHPEK